jgi:hypothetical protein
MVIVIDYECMAVPESAALRNSVREVWVILAESAMDVFNLLWIIRGP